MNPSHSSFYGWKLLAVSFAIFFLNGAFPFYGGSVMNTYMAEDLNIDRSLLGLGFTLLILLIGVTAPLTGSLVNKFGARYIIFIAGLLLTANALLMAFVVSQGWHYVLVFGIATGVVYGAGSMIPLQASVSHWFDKRRAFALSILLCSGAIGGLVAAPLLSNLISNFDGNWRAGWILVAGATLLASGLSWFVVDKPSDLDQHPDGINPEETGAETINTANDVIWKVKDAAKTPALWLIVYGAVALFSIFNLCIAHGIIHLRDSGFSDQLSSLSAGVLVATSLIGRIGGGILADRINIPYVWSASLLLLCGGVLVASSINENWQVFLYASLIGIGYGSAVVCMSAIIGRYFGAASFAPILGITYLFTSLLGSLSPLLAGIAYDNLGSYTPAFYVTAAISLIAAVLILFAKPPTKKQS